MLKTCITPKGIFSVGIHRPNYGVRNLRDQDFIMNLGVMGDGTLHANTANFPVADLEVEHGRCIYEIVNPLPFRGVTSIDSEWAAARSDDPGLIRIDPPPDCSLTQALKEIADKEQVGRIIDLLPRPLLYDLAANSTDPAELIRLARNCCRLVFDRDGRPTGLRYLKTDTGIRPDIVDVELFETVANNPYLPDPYKEVMVLRPGVQGTSEVVGELCNGKTHIFEYLRRNSYIPWGHYAANMAHDAIRYRIDDLSLQDMQGLRFLYYQRMVVALAFRLGVKVEAKRRSLSDRELEQLRKQVLAAAEEAGAHPATLWGWNFGYDFSGSGYRLHASHQMIHQQFAVVPEEVELMDGDSKMSYSCGDQVAEVVEQYERAEKSDFFQDYLRCLRTNRRTDGGRGESSLIVHEDDNVLLFVPKAQVSQWELQLMVLADRDGQPVGNVLEADTGVRASIDRALYIAQKIFAGLGAGMVTSVEYPKRLAIQNGQRLLYAFLPKLPWSMGGFSEAQQRFICGHYPEDFAVACRRQIPEDGNRGVDRD